MEENRLPNGWVRLNVGGKVFETTKLTLGREPSSFLARLCHDDQQLPSTKDASGAYMVDRDPRSFSIVLNYLRTGSLRLPPGSSLEELMDEAEFYNLSTLKDAIDGSKCTSKNFDRKEVKAVEMVIISRQNVGYHGMSEALIMTSEPERPDTNYKFIRELVRKGIKVSHQSGPPSRYVVKLDNRDCWDAFYIKTWSTLASLDFKCDKDEDSKWTFSRTLYD